MVSRAVRFTISLHDSSPDFDKTVFVHANGISIVRQGHRADTNPPGGRVADLAWSSTFCLLAVNRFWFYVPRIGTQ